MRSRRSLTTPRSRRGTILILAAVAFLLQGVHVIGLPRWAAGTPTDPGPVASASPRGDGMVAPPPGGSGNPGPTLTVPPPPGVPIPENAVLLYTQSPSAPSAASGTMRPLNPPEILRGLLLLHQAGKLDLPPEQARELLQLVKGVDGAYTGMRTARDEILQVLTPEQLQWLEDRPPAAGEIPEGAPEQNAEEPARKALDALAN